MGLPPGTLGMLMQWKAATVESDHFGTTEWRGHMWALQPTAQVNSQSQKGLTVGHVREGGILDIQDTGAFR